MSVPDPSAVDWVPLWNLGTAVAYGTTLPASPADGQEAILVDSITNPSYQWRFRYNAGSSSAYKWEFVGGGPRSTMTTPSETTASTSLVDLATVGPSFTIPRAGEYLISGSMLIQGAAAATFALADFCRNGASIGLASVFAHLGVAGAYQNGSVAPFSTAFATSDVLKLMYRTSGATIYFQQRILNVIPVRVS